MKRNTVKKLALISAILCITVSGTGCNNASARPVIETTTLPSEEPTEKLVEIDPFEGIRYYSYRHNKDGVIEEEDGKNDFYDPETITVDGKTIEVQFESYAGCYGSKQCSELGCPLRVYREVLDQDMKQGDTVTFHLYLDGIDIPEKDIPAYVEDNYGIRLTRTELTPLVHINEKKITEVDPFEIGDENKGIYFKLEDVSFTVENTLEECRGCKTLERLGLKVGYDVSLEEGLDINDLYYGDKVKATVVLKDGDKEYKGDEANKYLDSTWYRVKLTETEKIYEIPIQDVSFLYNKNVNVNIERANDWHQVATDKKLFTKYDFRHIDGSTATIPITCELLRQFCGFDDITLAAFLDHNTTGPAYEYLITGAREKNIIFVTEPSKEELEMAAANGVELDVSQIALDGFVFITHKDNPVDSLTVEQIQRIYTGEITNWKDVGGNDEEIIPYQREANSGSQTVMENMVMNGLQMMEAPKGWVPSSMGGLVDSVANYNVNANTLGYTFNYYLNSLYRSSDIKVLKINGISPDNENLINKTYPFSSGYYAVTLKGGDERAEELKQYLLSDEGQEIVKLAGYCPIR